MLHPSQPGLGNKEEIDSKLEPPYLALESKVDNNYFHESDELHYDKIQRRIHYRRLEEKNQTDFTFFFFFLAKTSWQHNFHSPLSFLRWYCGGYYYVPGIINTLRTCCMSGNMLSAWHTWYSNPGSRFHCHQHTRIVNTIPPWRAAGITALFQLGARVYLFLIPQRKSV